MKMIAISLAAIFGLVSNTGSGPLPMPVSASDGVLAGKVRATDGDSLRMGERRIRLYGIDAPETSQTCQLNGKDWDCGRAARKALERLTKGRVVTCEVRDMDRTRFVSVCRVGGVDINRQMVRRGWAVAYIDYSRDYTADEAAARSEGLALWRSRFERPQNYRARLRTQMQASREIQLPPSTDCNIKGNISRSGTRIAHLPGQHYYQATQINTKQGERWFCSLEQAQAAGWRLAMR